MWSDDIKYNLKCVLLKNEDTICYNKKYHYNT